MNESLQLRFDPRTIEHLGIKMYSRLPSALAELVANSYDAMAKEVTIKLYDNDKSNISVVVVDDGDGMSFEEVNNNFLIIGRKRRSDNDDGNNSRKITGRKGLGKLALFGIGKSIGIKTKKYGENKLLDFDLDWNDILNENTGVYSPKFKFITSEVDLKGTEITVSKLKRVTEFNENQIAVSLSKLFNFIDNDFKVYISRNDGERILVTKEMKFDGIEWQFNWEVNELINIVNPEYKFKDNITGTILSSLKPLNQDMRGITLYSRGRQANAASFFGLSEAGHTFSYLTGWINADFIDEQSDDIISTDRQEVVWENELASDLQITLQKALRYIVNEWSKKRSEAKVREIAEKSSIEVKAWVDKVPKEIKPELEHVLDLVSRQPELDNVEFNRIIKSINNLIPEYTYYHYRFLHHQIQEVAKESYESGKFYTAFSESMKRYKNKVKEKSQTLKELDLDIITDSFGAGKLLDVTCRYSRPNGLPFSELTLKNIEEGQHFLSMGIIKGGRNILSHEEISDLLESKLFTESDCLDLLSLLSHLFKRLDNSKRR